MTTPACFRSARLTSLEVYAYTKQFFDEGLLSVEDYFHERFCPYFVIVGVVYDPSIKKFGGVAYYKIASFFPLKGFGHDNAADNSHTKEKDAYIANPLGEFDENIWLYRIRPQTLMERISYQSAKDIEAYVADLSFRWKHAATVAKVANDDRNENAWHTEVSLHNVKVPHQRSNEIKDFKERKAMMRENILLKVQLQASDLKYTELQRKLKDLAQVSS